MTTLDRRAEPGPRAVRVPCGDGRALSGLLVEPTRAAQGTVLALHGAGMSARYFDADGGDRSFLRTAASAGLRVLALDRPGYGATASAFPDGLGVDEQAACIAEAVREFELDPAEVTLFGHSFGSKVALAIAATGLLDVQHVEFAGLGHRYAVDPSALAAQGGRRMAHLHWGPVRCYPPGTFTAARDDGIVQDTPPSEILNASRWPAEVGHLAAKVPCTVHASFAEYERFWRMAPRDIAAMSALFETDTFSSSSIPGTGHNSSLGHAASDYHRDVCARIIAGLRAREGTS